MFSCYTDTSSLRKQRSHQACIAALCALLALGCSILCPTAHTQTAGTGALSGSVTDPSGAAVYGVQAKVTAETTEEMRTVSSRGNGSYFVALLLPGLYEPEVTGSGFKTAHSSAFLMTRPILLNWASNLRRPVK